MASEMQIGVYVSYLGVIPGSHRIQGCYLLMKNGMEKNLDN